MQKHAQPLSPRTQAFAAPTPSGDEAQTIFEEGFTQMAYNVMASKFPDLMPEVVTFKVLDSDVEQGAGIGAFVLQHDNEILYVPVVMADNQIKPVDLFYHKQLNMFLPLNMDWLQEISQLTLDEMGETVQMPKSLRRDVDTRHIMIPPTTGNRYGYAAAKNAKPDLHQDLAQMLAKLQEKTAHHKPLFPILLAHAPEGIKTAFVTLFQKRPQLAFQLGELYGHDQLYNALQKTASATDNKGGALFIATPQTPSKTFKEVFGDRSAEAFQGALRKGYVAKDNRENLNIPVQIQEQITLQTPAESGFYRVYTRDGDAKPAFILHNPRQLHPNTSHCWDRYRARSRDRLAPEQHHKNYIVILDDGQWARISESLVAHPLRVPSEAAAFGKLCNGKNGDQPQVGDRGIFIKKLGKTFVGTEPFTIKNIATDSKGVRRITLDNYERTILITDKFAAKAGLHQPKGSNIMYIPPDARFIRLKEWDDATADLLRDPQAIQRLFYDKFDAMGANSLTIKNAHAGQFSINGSHQLRPFLDTVKQAALQFHIPFDSAEALVKQAGAPSQRRATTYILSPAMYEKIAQMPMMGGADLAMAGGMPSGAPMDPSSMMGMPPAPPSPPSPLDIAMGEAQTQIQQQAMDLEQQNMALQDKAQTLMMVQQRAQEIATGGQAAVQQGAPPMPTPGGMPAPGGAAPGGMPAPAPQMAPGGMIAAGQSPAEGQMMPPTGAMMATESPSAAEMPAQINPQFLEQAAALQDVNAFDAAALSSMAQSPSFRDMVVDYVPTLERALDNLGRALLTLWIQEREIKEQLGDETFGDMEDNLRAVFEGLGKLVLQLNRNAILMSPGGAV